MLSYDIVEDLPTMDMERMRVEEDAPASCAENKISSDNNRALNRKIFYNKLCAIKYQCILYSIIFTLMCIYAVSSLLLQRLKSDPFFMEKMAELYTNMTDIRMHAQANNSSNVCPPPPH